MSRIPDWKVPLLLDKKTSRIPGLMVPLLLNKKMSRIPDWKVPLLLNRIMKTLLHCKGVLPHPHAAQPAFP